MTVLPLICQMTAGALITFHVLVCSRVWLSSSEWLYMFYSEPTQAFAAASAAFRLYLLTR